MFILMNLIVFISKLQMALGGKTLKQSRFQVKELKLREVVYIYNPHYSVELAVKWNSSSCPSVPTGKTFCTSTQGALRIISQPAASDVQELQLR